MAPMHPLLLAQKLQPPLIKTARSRLELILKGIGVKRDLEIKGLRSTPVVAESSTTCCGVVKPWRIRTVKIELT